MTDDALKRQKSYKPTYPEGIGAVDPMSKQLAALTETVAALVKAVAVGASQPAKA